MQDRFRIVFDAQPLSNLTPERSPIQLWPNPVKDGVLYLRSSTAEKTWQGRITNVHGQIVQDFQLSLSHEAQALDLSSALSEGVYFVRLEDE
ncbi:T9SS type A sorting domain-containing protein, partial [Arthrospira platensis SPKY1]|nr:T9SS type A sorting domain-containing protein [Arthrospira platensis SPKY1]